MVTCHQEVPTTLRFDFFQKERMPEISIGLFYFRSYFLGGTTPRSIDFHWFFRFVILFNNFHTVDRRHYTTCVCTHAISNIPAGLPCKLLG